MSLPKLFLLQLSLLLVTAPSLAQSPSCYDPMEIPGRCLPWGYTDLSSVLDPYLVIDLSRDGSTLAGLGFPLEIIRWRSNEGVRVFDGSTAGITNPKLYLHGPVMSDTGSFIAADGLISGESRTFRWDVEAGDAAALVLPPGPAQIPSEPDVTVTPRIDASISGDGQMIVGRGEAFFDNGSVYSPFWPSVWENASGTDGGLQQDFTFLFVPHVIDGMGLRIAGREFTNNIPSEERAAFWTETGGSTIIGSFPRSRFTATSYDGSVLAGYRENFIGFRWTSAGAIQDITTVGFQPRAISDDGTLISGSATADPRQPWIWRQGTGSQHLYDYLINFGLDAFAAPVLHLNDHAIVSGDGNVFSVTGTQWVAKVSPLQVVALGDSYSSGEGALHPGEKYRPGTDTDDPMENRCHRSTSAYPAVLRPPTSQSPYREIQDFAAVSTGFVWDFIACSGATTANVILDGNDIYDEPPQLAQGEIDGDTDLVTITIGGNDALFSAVVADCVLEINCFDELAPGDSRTWREYLTDEIPTRIKDDVLAVYDEIKSESEGNATIIALGYPLLLAGDNGCLGAIGIGADEREFMRQMGMLLNDSLAKAAMEAGIHFVPVAATFEGHNVCDSTPWIKGISPLEQRSHWFHPNVTGQAAYARAVEEYFRRVFSLGYERGFFESGMPRNPVPAL